MEHLSEENREFILSLHKKNKSGYVIQKTFVKHKDYFVSKVFLEEDREKTRPKIMKVIYLKEHEESLTRKNRIINAIRVTYDIISYMGKHRCHSRDRFICYTDFFVYDTFKNKKPSAFAYVYDMAEGIDLFDITDRYEKKYIKDILSDDTRTMKEKKEDASIYNSELTCGCRKKTTIPSYETHISFEEIVNIAYFIFSSLAILQYNGINHRDIKPENVVYNLSESIGKRLRLIDFDFSIDECDGDLLGTRGYESKNVLFYRKNDLCDKRMNWNYNDIVSTAITIFKIYVKDVGEEEYFDFDKKLDRSPKDISLRKDHLQKLMKRELTRRKKVCSSFDEKIEKEFLEWMVVLMENDTAKTKLNGEKVCDLFEKKFGDVVHKKLITDYASEMKYYKSSKK